MSDPEPTPLRPDSILTAIDEIGSSIVVALPGAVYEEGRVRLRTVVLRRDEGGFVTETPGDDWVFTPPAFVTVPRGEMYGISVSTHPLTNTDTGMSSLLGANLTAEQLESTTDPAPAPTPQRPRHPFHDLISDPPAGTQSNTAASKQSLGETRSEPSQNPPQASQERPKQPTANQASPAREAAPTFTLEDVAAAVAAHIEGSDIPVGPAIENLKLTRAGFAASAVTARLAQPPYQLRLCGDCGLWFSGEGGGRKCLSCR